MFFSVSFKTKWQLYAREPTCISGAWDVIAPVTAAGTANWLTCFHMFSPKKHMLSHSTYHWRYSYYVLTTAFRIALMMVCQISRLVCFQRRTGALGKIQTTASASDTHTFTNTATNKKNLQNRSIRFHLLAINFLMIIVCETC